MKWIHIRWSVSFLSKFTILNSSILTAFTIANSPSKPILRGAKSSDEVDLCLAIAIVYDLSIFISSYFHTWNQQLKGILFDRPDKGQSVLWWREREWVRQTIQGYSINDKEIYGINKDERNRSWKCFDWWLLKDLWETILCEVLSNSEN